ncbi:MAG: ribonuclease III [Elusimicrobiales bacterium]|nr:ribonuclease III [Elusimicrobiales bacterium]
MFSDISELERKIKYNFKNIKILDKALTHKSYSSERKLSYSNERLEFLGDSVISLIVVEYLINKFPTKNEGYLSRIKSHIVSTKNLFKWAKTLSLEKYIKLSLAEIKSGGREKIQLISNALEALIGAVYLDGGLEQAKKIVYNFLESEKEISFEDYKSTLQEFCQKKFKLIPKYHLILQEGPEHKKIFTVSVSIKDKVLAQGTGYNKKEAENNAAKNALNSIKEVIL